MRILSLLALLVMPGVAVAQPAQEEFADGAPAGDGRSAVFRLAPRALHYFSTDLDDDATDTGDVAVSRFGALASLDIPVGSVSTITFAGEFTFSAYDFDGTGIFEEDNQLLSEAFEAGLGVTWSSRLGDHWTYFVGGGGRISGESGADVSDAVTGRAFGGIGYRFSERLSLGGGVGVSTQLDDDTLVVPIFTVFYQPHDDWILSAGGGPAAAGRVLGATLTWQPQPDLGLSLTGAWDRRQFRLDDDGPIVDGIATDSRVDIILGVNWGITEHIILRVEGGVSLAQEYEFDDADGDSVLDSEADATPFIGGSITFEF